MEAQALDKARWVICIKSDYVAELRNISFLVVPPAIATSPTRGLMTETCLALNLQADPRQSGLDLDLPWDPIAQSIDQMHVCGGHEKLGFQDILESVEDRDTQMKEDLAKFHISIVKG